MQFGCLSRNDKDLKAAFRRLESIFQAPEKTPEADERDVLVTLIEVYESNCYVITSVALALFDIADHE